jgi:hypothetical protein
MKFDWQRLSDAILLLMRMIDALEQSYNDDLAKLLLDRYFEGCPLFYITLYQEVL